MYGIMDTYDIKVVGLDSLLRGQIKLSHVSYFEQKQGPQKKATTSPRGARVKQFVNKQGPWAVLKTAKVIYLRARLRPRA